MTDESSVLLYCVEMLVCLRINAHFQEMSAGDSGHN